jgi:hypothetical protein
VSGTNHISGGKVQPKPAGELLNKQGDRGVLGTYIPNEVVSTSMGTKKRILEDKYQPYLEKN